MIKPAQITRLLLLICIVQLIEAQETVGNPEIYEGLVLGVGPGTLAIGIASIISMVLCLFKDATSSPTCVVIVAIAFPFIVLGIVRSMPTKSLESDEERKDELPTSSYFVRTTVICAIIYTVTLMLCLTICCSNFVEQIMGVRIDSSSLQQN